MIIRDRRTKVKTQFIHQLTCQSPSIVGVGNAGTACSQQSTVPVDALESAAYDIVAENVQHSDIDEDQDGNAIGVSGVLWGSFQSKQLRTICSRLAVRGVKNAKKSIMVEHIVRWHNNKKNYDAALLNRDTQANNTTRKTSHCAFRLMNVLFSHAIAGNFATIGDVSTKERV